MEKGALTTFSVAFQKSFILNTRTQKGQIVFIALEKLAKGGFTKVELFEALKQNGYTVPLPSLNALIFGLVGDGLFLKVTDGRKPQKYRLPSSIKKRVLS